MQPDLGLAPGHILADKYQLAECIGRGGMGEVWRAQHLALKADVAIKFIRTALSGAEEMTTRFVREAQAAAAIRSAHVVQILDYGMDGDMAYIVMELMQGESLGALLAREGRVTPDVLSRIMTHVARALARAHEAGIVHRDLKPDNIYLTQADDELIAKVLDFGIAKFQPGVTGTLDSNTRTGAMMGTPYYMSPEQAEGERQVDFRTDIWAMGVISYQALLGKLPFDSDALGGLLLRICSHPIPVPSQVGPVPQGFDQWFATAVNRDANARFASAKDAATALKDVCARAAGQSTLPAVAPTAPVNAGSAQQVALLATNQPLSRTLDPIPKRSALVPVLALGTVALALVAGGGYFALTRYQAGANRAATTEASAAPETAPSAAPELSVSDTPEVAPEEPAEADAGAAEPELEKPTAKQAPAQRPAAKTPTTGKEPSAGAAKPAPKPTLSVPGSAEGLL